jgi:hypothetical protein
MKVQQQLMRHASIQTTMNVYGHACNVVIEAGSESDERGNGAQVNKVLKSIKSERLNS